MSHIAPEPTGSASIEVEIDIDRAGLDQLRDRAGDAAPTTDEDLLRYLVYLGAGYLEAEAVRGGASSLHGAYERVDRMHGAVVGRSSVLSFHFGESAREFAEEERAHAAHERSAGAYEALVGKLEAEIAVREERIAHLEEALET
ncbi:MAG TPA: hypothetical protein VH816_10290 [Gaiellaceae bacterium]